MMNYSTIIVIGVCMVLTLGSVIWNRYFMSYLARTKDEGEERKSFLFSIKPASNKECLVSQSNVLLHNTDDDVSQALKYIRPTRHMDQLLEMLGDEQR